MAWRKSGETTWQGQGAKKTIVKKVAKGGADLAKGSRQQEAIWKCLIQTDKNIVVKALAGTGKTFTVIQGLHRVGRERPDIRSAAFIAFNRSIATELQTKVPSWVKASTCHSLMFGALQQALGKKMVDDNKTDRLLERAVGSEQDFWLLKRRDPQVIVATKKLVGLVKGTLLGYEPTCENGIDTNIVSEGLGELAMKYGVDMNGSSNQIVDYVRKIVEWSADDTESEGLIDFDDMIWLPILHTVKLPQFDLLCVDESQDLNACQQEAVLRMGKRVMIVGDENQAIYGFRGADVDAMRNIEAALENRNDGVEVLPLTMTRRCPKLHVKLAKEIVPEFTAMPEAPKGRVDSLEEERAIKQMQPGDLVVCRMNAPVVSMAFRLLAANVKCNIQGRDLGQGLLAFIKKLAGEHGSVMDLLRKLDDYEERETTKIMQRKHVNPSVLVALTDKCKCVRALADGAISIEGIRTRVEVLFADVGAEQDRRGFVLLSSVHRAKGLEADTVFILAPESMPHPMAKLPWEKQQEWNIRYVALTRSKDRLVFVPSKDR